MMHSILHFELLLSVAKCGDAVGVHRVKVSHSLVNPAGRCRNYTVFPKASFSIDGHMKAKQLQFK